ncbi:hypothetical protein H2200_005406 [Cladophialophora chaetospira]|uniref:Zn(2)-C6 fungal-type domain-containing protein n=1 Tax=Cladophialophora chaetospira TaxID=386627 RepID=A0AA38XC12_9EURO|nr:hypothetical protein H2200_005406 [Cladophialophora chaetospira]
MEEPPPAKKARLSMACNECRRRKVKCDAEYPQCRNCAHRNTECFTSDPRRPDIPVMRKMIEDVEVPAHSADNEPLASAPSQTGDAQIENAQLYSSISRSDATPTGSNAAGPELDQISPVYHPYDMSFHSEQRTNRFKMMGASSSQCLMKSLDLYLGTVNIKAVSPPFQHGMRHAEEITLPLRLTLPPFPASDTRFTYTDAYFTRIHVLWPFLDVDETKNSINYFATVTELNSVSRDQIPMLASAYLIMSLGADEEARAVTSDGENYLQAAAELLGHLVVVPYLPAVQALLLFTVAYRGRNKDGLGWQTMGLAIRIAHTLGLHRHSAITPSDQHGVKQKRDQLYHSRIWGVCCCLEKLLQLESGRPSAIFTVNRDQMMGQEQRAPGHDFLQWNVGLAEYQGEISHHMYGHKPGERTAKEIILNGARLDTALLAWAREIPLQFQPTSALFCSKEDLHFAAFLSIQFHQSMIALHRAALIAPRMAFDAEVEKHCSGHPSKHRLKQGESICTESARTIIRLSMEIQENKEESRILSTGPILLACVALSISLVKNPRGKMQAADLELLRVGVEFTSDQYLKSGQDRRMCQGVTGILEKIRQYIRNNPSASKRLRDHTVEEALSTSDHMIHSNGRPPADYTTPMAPPPTYHAAVSATSSGQVVGNPHFADVSGGALYNNINDWRPDRSIHPRSDNLPDSYGPGQSLGPEPGMDRMPFDDYNAEQLWNWMYFVDFEEGSPALMQQSL